MFEYIFKELQNIKPKLNADAVFFDSFRSTPSFKLAISKSRRWGGGIDYAVNERRRSFLL
jgi:hypothetical protein